LSKRKSDNLPDIGLMPALPMKSRSADATGSYYPATANDDFQSMANAKSQHLKLLLRDKHRIQFYSIEGGVSEGCFGLRSPLSAKTSTKSFAVMQSFAKEAQSCRKLVPSF
jgi:hypothetical protein